MKITFNESMSVFRPAWRQNNLRAFEDAAFCGTKPEHFKKTRGMPGRLLRREDQRRNRL